MIPESESDHDVEMAVATKFVKEEPVRVVYAMLAKIGNPETERHLDLIGGPDRVMDAFLRLPEDDLARAKELIVDGPEDDMMKTALIFDVAPYDPEFSRGWITEVTMRELGKTVRTARDTHILDVLGDLYIGLQLEFHKRDIPFSAHPELVYLALEVQKTLDYE